MNEKPGHPAPTDAPAGAGIDIEFATPGDWVAMRLPGTERDVQTVLEELMERRPDLEARRNLVASVLTTLSEASRSTGCVYAGGTFIPLPGGAMPVTLLVNAVPAGDGEAPPAPPGGGDQPGRSGYAASTVDLPCGRGTRAEWFQAARLADEGAAILSFLTQYIVHLRARQAILLLTFSTPAVSIASSLREVFAAIATSVTVATP